MSSLSDVIEYLEKDCLCHKGFDLEYCLESMPSFIKQPKVKKGCDCKHGQEKDIKRALRQFKVFFETQSPFKVGDRVELAVTPEITPNKAHGWLGSKHFLIEGAKGIVRDVSYRCAGEFGYDVEFDNETWQDEAGLIHPVSRKHTYYFKQSSLRETRTINTFLKQLWNEFHKIGD